MKTTDEIYDAAEDYIIFDWRHSGEADARLRELARNDLHNRDRWDVLVKSGLDSDLCACVVMLDGGQQFQVTVPATTSRHAAEVRLTVSKPDTGDPEGTTHVVAQWPADDFTLRREFTRVDYALDWLKSHVDTDRMIDGPPDPEDFFETSRPSPHEQAGQVC